MATPKQLHIIATRPAAYARFVATGQLPQGIRPCSPLIDLLSAIALPDRLAIRGVTIDERLGYQGSRRFHNAELALQWVRPSSEVFDSFPAETWRTKAFHRVLTLKDLAECCSLLPEAMFARYPRLGAPPAPRP